MISLLNKQFASHQEEYRNIDAPAFEAYSYIVLNFSPQDNAPRSLSASSINYSINSNQSTAFSTSKIPPPAMHFPNIF